jgi:hypothetical protein
LKVVAFVFVQNDLIRDGARHNFCQLLEWQVYQAKEVKRAVRSSATGERVYVAVRAHAEGGACANVAQLFVSGRTGEFRKVFEAEPTKSDDGNGMRLIGWNREGTRLMAELGRFAYGSDALMSRESSSMM